MEMEDYMSHADKAHSIKRRLLCMLCALSILTASSITLWLIKPGWTMSADPVFSASNEMNLVADVATMDSWQKYFGANVQNTEYAGGVWVDKSVMTGPYAYAADKEPIAPRDNHFLVALSAIGSTQHVMGIKAAPTDVMIILDLSSSMYGSAGAPVYTKVRDMVNAVNTTIDALFALNENSRVGVVTYYGIGRVDKQTDKTHSIVLMPLDRYEKESSDATYLSYTYSGGSLRSVHVSDNVKNAAGEIVQGEHKIPLDNGNQGIAGTYSQLGILDAMTQFTNVPKADTTVNGVTRQPVFIFMSDGRPTAATENYWYKADATMGNNQESSRAPNETDFVTQLTAAYAKEQVKLHYNTQPLYYTLGLGTNSVSLDVMDPAAQNNATINQYWSTLISSGSVSFQTKNYETSGGYSNPKDIRNHTVTKTTSSNGLEFPNNMEQRLYVDKYFAASDSGKLGDAFSEILINIQLQTPYHPTFVEENAAYSGYVSFIDTIGQYMSITDIKGISVGNTLYTGLNIAKNFTAGEQLGAYSLGTGDNLTALGEQFHHAVMTQLGLGEESYELVAQLIDSAYQKGQLFYNEASGEFSNYIGWYADANQNYLGFWYDGIDADPNYTVPENPAYIIKSYFYQGKTTPQEAGVANSDMMYAIVWVKTDLETGRETLIFSVPASILPTVSYAVELNQEKQPVNLTVSGAEEPIRLYYEVGLKATALEEVIDDQAYLHHESGKNLSEDKSKIYFYTNEWERSGATGYNLENTYAYFRPSMENDRYYYQADAKVYQKDDSGNFCEYKGEKPIQSPDTNYYTQYVLYENLNNGETGARLIYVDASQYAVGQAVNDREDGVWYIPKGTAHNIDENGQFALFKQENGQLSNKTGTLTIANQPFVDIHLTTNRSFVIGATLGNNGRLEVMPACTVSLQKKLVNADGSPYQAPSGKAFQFLIHEGNQLKDEAGNPIDYTSAQAIANALGNRKISLVNVSVLEGKTESGMVGLKNLKPYKLQEGTTWMEDNSVVETWGCTFGKDYTIVEWDAGEDFRPDSINGKAYAPYTFTCGLDSNPTIICANEVVHWGIHLTKYESEAAEKVLPGAVFALYGPNEAESIQPPSDYPNLPATKTTTDENGGNAKTWHLTAVATTDQDGAITWNNLTQDNYLLLEIQAPPGYYLNSDTHIIQRNNLDANNIRTYNICNDPGCQLPETGGPGNGIFVLIGLTLCTVSALLLIKQRGTKDQEAV